MMRTRPNQGFYQYIQVVFVDIAHSQANRYAIEEPIPPLAPVINTLFSLIFSNIVSYYNSNLNKGTLNTRLTLRPVFCLVAIT